MTAFIRKKKEKSGVKELKRIQNQSVNQHEYGLAEPCSTI